MSETFFTSDTHFDHLNIIKFCNRPYTYPNVEEMNQGLEEQWNKRVGPKDMVWHLGDVRWKNFDLHRLNGIKYLVAGNHDSKRALSQYFVEIHDYVELRNHYQGKSIMMMHYPIESWNGKYHGSIHFHGHTHGTLDNSGLLRFDVGVDCFNMAPVTLDEIWQLIPERKRQAEDKQVALMRSTVAGYQGRDEGFKKLNETADKG
jgi:calcineurin-like phosphoesterase family protein